MFFDTDKSKFKNIELELLSISSRIKILELENSKLVEHMKSLRGSINRKGKDETSEDETDEGKDIKGTKYY